MSNIGLEEVMQAIFVSGVKLTAIPENGDGIEYEANLRLCEEFGPIVELACGDESVLIHQGAWDSLKEQIDGLLHDDEA